MHINPIASIVPTVIEDTGNSQKAFDIFSMLLRKRIIILNDQVNSHTAGLVIAQLIHLESEDPDQDITLYINSPGGSVSDGLGIFDTMNYIKPDVSTICTGMAASMGSFLLAAGTKGKRFILPNSEVMIHQVLSGFQGQATDIEIHAKHTLRLKQSLTQHLADMCGQDYDTVFKACERDNYLTAQEAVDFGLVDKVITRRGEL